MADMRGYSFLPGRSAVELADGAVRDDSGAWHRGDWVFVCTGARRTGLVEQYVERPPTRRVRLQMLETAPYPGRVTTALADGDSMRYYPAFDLPGRGCRAAGGNCRPLPLAIAGGSAGRRGPHHRGHARLRRALRFDLDEAAYAHLLGKAAEVLRQPLPPVRRRWAGVYSEMLDKERNLIGGRKYSPGAEVINGPGGTGDDVLAGHCRGVRQVVTARAGA